MQIFQALLRCTFGQKRSGLLTILKYHRVLPLPDPLVSEIDAATFNWQCQLLKRFYNVMTLSEAVQRLKKQSLPPRAVCITFDDGYLDNVEVALPILKTHGLCATFFIMSGAFDIKAMWNDQVIESIRQCNNPSLDLHAIGLGDFSIENLSLKKATILKLLPELKYLEMSLRDERVQVITKQCGAEIPRLMMNPAQIKQLFAAGMEIGGHTVNHPILARLTAVQARLEIMQGKEDLEAILGEKLKVFAYPNGQPEQDYQKIHVDFVQKLGFEAAVSTSWGVCQSHMDVFQLPRMSPAKKGPLHFAGRMIQNARLPPECVTL